MSIDLRQFFTTDYVPHRFKGNSIENFILNLFSFLPQATIDETTEYLDEDEVAQEGISCLESFIKELGIVTSISELGATREMLPLIANSTVLGGAYKKLTAEEVLKILENCF